MDVRFKPLTVWPRKFTPAHSRKSRFSFKAYWPDTLRLLEDELRHLGAHDIVIEIAVDSDSIRLDGWPRSDACPTHPGVVLSFESRHGPLRYVTDRYEWWQHNVRAIALGLQALRAVDRYGITYGSEQYKGWTAIEATSSSNGSAVEVLAKFAGVQVATDLTADSTRSLYRRALMKAHPDHGGTADALAEVQEAGRKLGVG